MKHKKSVLFICPSFFGYEIDIRDAIIHNGFDVDFFDERTSNNSLYKAIFRVKKSLLKWAIKRHYDAILDEIKEKRYSYFLLIKGEVVPEFFITEFKRLNPEAKLIYYTYDSFNNNNSNSIYILKHFDSCFSFDFEDVKKNPQLTLKHLFYSDDFSRTPVGTEKKYSISFIGTLHSNRYQVIKTICNQVADCFTFFYMPAKWFLYYSRLTNSQFKKINIQEVSFSKITKKEVAEVFRASKSVLDIQRFGQSGLTMRTFEVLASGAILITTNKHILEAEFFSPDHIIVIDDLDSVDIALLKAEIDAKLILHQSSNFSIEAYNVNNWVKEFFI